MATVYDLLNPSGTVAEESRIIRAPGATTGDVLTVQANKTIAPAAGGGGSATVKHVVVPLTFADIDTGTGFIPVYLLPDTETVIASWPVITEAFNGTSGGFPMASARLYGPTGQPGSGEMGDLFTLTDVSADSAADGLIFGDPGGGPGSTVTPMLPLGAPVPGGGSVQLIIDATDGQSAPYTQGTTGALAYHLVIAL